MECLSGCDFQKLTNGKFYCEYYNCELEFNVESMCDNIKIMRCENCINEKLIGQNSIQEKAKKVKYRIGLIMDSFYSFKDDIESQVTEIYRNLKDLENEDKQVEKTENS